MSILKAASSNKALSWNKLEHLLNAAFCVQHYLHYAKFDKKILKRWNLRILNQSIL